MRKSGILNSELQCAITELRHGDGLAVVDQGFPIPKGSYVIDLSLVSGIPTFRQVIKALMDEMRFCEYYLVEMIDTENPEYYELISKNCVKYDIKEIIPMADFVEKVKEAKVVIRTAEPLPFSNIYLTSCSGDPWSAEEYEVTID